jgi:hypothetical protein
MLRVYMEHITLLSWVAATAASINTKEIKILA